MSAVTAGSGAVETAVAAVGRKVGLGVASWREKGLGSTASGAACLMDREASTVCAAGSLLLAASPEGLEVHQMIYR